MSSNPKTFLTPEQYLEIERAAEYKSEYFNGEMFPLGDGLITGMAGAVESHNLITLNTGGELRQQFKGRPCKAYVSDMRVRVGSTGLYTYPTWMPSAAA